MAGAPTATAGAPAPPPAAAHDLRLVRRVVEAYELVRQDLAADDWVAAKRDAILVGVTASEGPGATWMPAVQAARAVTQQLDIAGSRRAFADLTEALWAIVLDTPEVRGAVRGVRCVAARQRWLQLRGDLGNPYEGPSAAPCAEAFALSR